jgi:RP/EB family microtubule-associated protein
MGGAPDYDGVARRKHAKCKEPTERGRPDKKPAGMAKRQGAIALAPSAKARAAALAEAKAEPKAEPRPKPVKKADPPAPKQPKPAPVASEAKEAKRGKVAKLEEDLEQAVQERDFYYEKLRRVEDFCQENENDPQLKQILEILYEADPSRGFLPPEEED